VKEELGRPVWRIPSDGARRVVDLG